MNAEEAKKAWDYDPETGKFIWKIGTKMRGKEAGTIKRVDGYRRIFYNGKFYSCANIAWLISTGEWPEEEIDHINCDREDNRLANLRPATRKQNAANKKAYGKTGARGVVLIKGRYQARIQANKKMVHLGCFDTLEEAAQAYRSAAIQTYGEFARY